MVKVIIRADASVHIGSGHVRRCLTLADALKALWNDVSIDFMMDVNQPGELSGLVESKGFGIIAHTQDESVLNHTIDWLIVDHYDLDQAWEKQALQCGVKHIMVIDDLADRPHDCDILLDQNFIEGQEERYQALVRKDCQQLLGPRYALLRDEFSEWRLKVEALGRQPRQHVKRLLVNFGGSDPQNLTSVALDALEKFLEFKVDVVMGSAAPYKEAIVERCKSKPNWHCYVDANNMAELFVKADLAIGAGGSTSWERCAVGLPAAVVITADNQREIVHTCHKAGVLSNLGEHQDFSLVQLEQFLEGILTGHNSLVAMSEKAYHLVDGKGAMLVAQKIQELSG